jgi:integrase
MASITKRVRKDGTPSYRVEIRLKGFPSQRATFSRKTDAKKWAQNTESAIRERRFFKTAEAQKHTLEEMIQRYIREVLPTKSRNINQKSQLEWWAKEIGAYTLADVTPALISQCRDKLTTKLSLAPATVVRYMAALSHTFTVAINDWGWLEDSPLRKVRKPKLPHGRVRFLDDDERTNLLDACQESDNEYLYLVVVLALSTGMRKSEIMWLKWPDVNLTDQRITLHKTKNKERRVVPIAGHALELLREHNKVRKIDSDFLFPGRNKADKPIDLRTPWETALKRSDVDNFRFHDLRHSAASYLAMNGASLAEIADVLGHKTFQMVKRYAHLSEAHTAGVVTSMNEKIFGGRT